MYVMYRLVTVTLPEVPLLPGFSHTASTTFSKTFCDTSCATA